jgi:hypothetical protein
MVGSSGAYLPDMSQFNSENINTYVDQIKDNNKLQTSMLDELKTVTLPDPITLKLPFFMIIAVSSDKPTPILFG